MEKHLVIIGFLVIIGGITVLFGKVIGPKLLDWIAPVFNRITNRLDDAIMGKPGEWEAKVREIVEATPDQLRQRVDDLCSRFAEPAPAGWEPPSWLPPGVRWFFQKYSHLSFDGHTRILDATALRVAAHKSRRYGVIGRSEDQGHFYAVDLQNNTSIVLLETDDSGAVFGVEDDAPSLEHFVTLQYELHLHRA